MTKVVEYVINIVVLMIEYVYFIKLMEDCQMPGIMEWMLQRVSTFYLLIVMTL